MHTPVALPACACSSRACESSVELFEGLGVVAAKARAVGAKMEDASEVPRDVARECLLAQLKERVRGLAVDAHLFHETAAVPIQRQVFGQLETLQKWCNLFRRKLLPTELVRREEQYLQPVNVLIPGRKLLVRAARRASFRRHVESYDLLSLER